MKAAPLKDQFPWGWAGTWKAFSILTEREYLWSLVRHLQERWLNHEISKAQIDAWRIQYKAFQNLVNSLADLRWGTSALIAFEFELLLYRGNRPDVILTLPTNTLLVLECKNSSIPKAADFHQIGHYVQSIQSFYAETQNIEVRGGLCLLAERSSKSRGRSNNGVPVYRLQNGNLLGVADLIKTMAKGAHAPSYTCSLPRTFIPRRQMRDIFAQRLNASSLSYDGSFPELHALISEKIDEAESVKRCSVFFLPCWKGQLGLGLRWISEAHSKGFNALYLTGNPNPQYNTAYIENIVDGEAIPKSVESAVRHTAAFGRACLPTHLIPTNVIVLDSFGACAHLPLSANTDSYQHEYVMAEIANALPWCVFVILVDYFPGNFTREVARWWGNISCYNSKGRQWQVSVPYPIALQSECVVSVFPQLWTRASDTLQTERTAIISDIRDNRSPTNQEKWMRLRNACLPELPSDILSRDRIPSELITMGQLTRPNPEAGSLISLAACWGKLRDLPQRYLTWEVISLGIESCPQATPLRDAAKYDHLDQVPPESCTANFEEAKKIVTAAVASSQNYGKPERRLKAAIWLLKVLFSKVVPGGKPVPELLESIKNIIDEVRSAGGAVPLGNYFLEGDVASRGERIGSLAVEFLATKEENCLLRIVQEEYFAALIQEVADDWKPKTPQQLEFL